MPPPKPLIVLPGQQLLTATLGFLPPPENTVLQQPKKRQKKSIQVISGQQALQFTPTGSYLLTEYRPLDYWLDETIRANPNEHFRQMAVRFRRYFEATNTTWVYLGSRGDFCYYRDAGFNEYRAYAPLFGGIEVGQVSIDDDYYLYNLNVHVDFRRRGIGTNLIIFANDTTRLQTGFKLLVLKGTQAMHSRQHPNERFLTDDGWNLIKHCRNQDILEYTQLIGPSNDPSLRHYSQSPTYVPLSPVNTRSPPRRSSRHHDGMSPSKRRDYREY